MNLVNVVIRSEDILIPVFGIGNVCAKYKGKGYGKRLLEEVNKFIRTRNEKGMLFCKSYLVDFYQRNNWRLIKSLHPNPEVCTMVFNFNIDGRKLKYQDRLF